MNDEIRKILSNMSKNPQLSRILGGRNPEEMVSDDPRAMDVLESLSNSGPEEIEKFAKRLLDGPQGEMLRQILGDTPTKP